MVKHLISLLLVLGLITHCIGQPDAAKTTILNVTSGLSGLAAKNIHVDDEAKIWFETENGIDRWNGVSLVKQDLPGLPKSDYGGRRGSIITFAEDDRYVYLFYKNNQDSFDVYDKKNRTFSPISYNVTLTQLHTLTVTLDKKNRPWLVLANADSIHINSIFNDHQIQFSIPESEYFELEQVYIGTNGLWIYDQNYNLKYLRFNGGVTSFNLSSQGVKLNIPQITNVFKEVKSEELWFSVPGYAGLQIADPANGQIRSVEGIPKDKLVIHLWEDEQNRKLIALSDDLQITRRFMIAEGHASFIPWDYLSSISTIATQVVSEDFYDLMYFATHQGLQVIRFNEAFLSTYLHQPDKPSDQYGTIITSITPFMAQQMLITDEDNPMYIFDDANETVSETTPFIKYPGQFPLWVESINTLTTIIKGDSEFENVIVSQDFTSSEINKTTIPSNTTSTAFDSEKNDLLIAGEYENRVQLFVYDVEQHEIEVLPMAQYPLLARSKINHLYYDINSRKLYISSFNQGLLVADWSNNKLGKAKKLSVPEMTEKNIISINMDNAGNLLVGSYEGLYIVDREQYKIIRHITTSDGLSNDVIAACIQDKYGMYWIATFSGLHVMHPRDFHIGLFQKKDGLPYEEFNRNAAATTKNGNLLFGTGNGFLKVNPDIFKENQPTFSILYGGATLKTKDEDIELDTLPLSAVSMRLGNFSGIDILLGNNDWGRKEEVTYYYRVEDLDSEWSKTRENPIRIDRLPEGKYNIQIKASSRSGHWSSNSLTIPIDLYVPFYNKNWVRIVSVSLFISMIALTYLINYRRRARTKFEFQSRVSDLELRLLQSQMNPHFIFNALGAIQFYIFNNQKDIAENYLSKFASLMRMFLESSRNNFITLKEEVRLLKGYVELEHLRFPDKFESTFDIKLDDQMDNYSVPAMLFQPFLENSINHGLFHSDESGKLFIRFYDDAQALYCEIEDNGIGRRRAREIKSKSIRMYKSRSTQIIEERIEVLKEAENMHIKIAYDDYDPSADGKSGTKVTIRIPFNKKTRVA